MRNVVVFNTKCVSKMGRVRSAERRVRDDDFILGYLRNVVEMSSNRLNMGGRGNSGISRKILNSNFVAGAVLGEFDG